MNADNAEHVDGARTRRVLIVEDEAHLASGLKLNLELEGYEAEVATTGRAAAAALVSVEGFDLVILDVMLPDMDGYTLCRKLRDSGNYVPVIMLTARSSATDRVQGLEAGADDYLPKPFELPELLARVRSQLRRQRWTRGPQAPARPDHVLQFGQARVDFDAYEVEVGGEPRKLTQLEMELLRYFADHAGRVVSREELMSNVWRLKHHPNTRTVDNFVGRLRKHFEVNPAEPMHFVSVRGAGYKFVPMPQ